MLSLSLLRHAKSSWDDTVARDFDRPLNAKGRRAAAAMGAFIGREALAWDLVLASPAQRVRQTIEGLQDGLGRAFAPVFDTRVYMAGVANLTEVLAGVPASSARVLLVGHNPGLEDLALWLVAGGAPGRGAIEEKYPTAALAELTLEVASWSGVTEGSARLARFTRPRDLDPALGPDED